MQPLAGRFLQLVLQLQARFGFWLTSGLAARSGVPPLPSAAESSDISASDRWAVGMNADQLCSLRADTERMADWLSKEYISQFLQLLSFASQEVRMDPNTMRKPYECKCTKPLG